MTDFINFTMNKSEFNSEVYRQWAVWCNENQCMIVENGDVYQTQQIEKRELSYQEKRRMAYPDIGEQLDMIYWDKINQTNMWADTISKIKADYPKE